MCFLSGLWPGGVGKDNGGETMKIASEYAKEIATLKELVKEIHKILDDDDDGEWSDNIEEWLVKAEKVLKP
jgi:hypothetical protein